MEKNWLENEELFPKKKSNSGLKIVLIILVILLAGGLAYALFHISGQQNELKEAETIAEMSKQQMEETSQQLAHDYDSLLADNEMKLVLDNQALVKQLEDEQAKVKKLQAELKSTKATNTAEILRLNNELNSLREISRNLYYQIDTLYQANQKLRGENAGLKADLGSAQGKITVITGELGQAKGTIEIARQLKANNISILPTDGKKQQTKIKKIKQFNVSFTIAANDVAERGVKNVYVRIVKPNGDVLSKSGTFKYESNPALEYSVKGSLEYDGEAATVVLYCPVNETLLPTTYKAEIFVGSQRLGSASSVALKD